MTTVGSVAELRRYPVKSMLVSVKYPKRWGRIFELRAITDDAGVHVSFPDGRRLAMDDGALAARLSDYLGRPVTVAVVPPTGATFDELWLRDLKDDRDAIRPPVRAAELRAGRRDDQ
jgi:hypothetical protein